MLWDGLHYFSEPLFKYWPFTKLRERSLKRAIELIRYYAEESRYITMANVEKVNYLNNDNLSWHVYLLLDSDFVIHTSHIVSDVYSLVLDVVLPNDVLVGREPERG